MRRITLVKSNIFDDLEDEVLSKTTDKILSIVGAMHGEIVDEMTDLETNLYEDLKREKIKYIDNHEKN